MPSCPHCGQLFDNDQHVRAHRSHCPVALQEANPTASGALPPLPTARTPAGTTDVSLASDQERWKTQGLVGTPPPSEMDFVRNELANIRYQLHHISNTPSPAPAMYGGMGPYGSASWPLIGHDYGYLKNVKAPRRPRRVSRRSRRGAGRRKKKSRSRRYEEEEEEDSSDTEDYSDEDSYGSDDDDDEYSDESEEYDSRDRRRRKKAPSSHRSRSASGAQGNGVPRQSPKRRSLTAGAASTYPKKNIYDFLNNTPRPGSHEDHLLAVVQTMRQEIDTLKNQTDNFSVPFPTVSELNEGVYSLELSTLEGVDLSVPLSDVQIAIKQYHLYFEGGEYVMDPRGETVYAGAPTPLTRAGSSLCVFTVRPIEFIVRERQQMFVFVLQINYRGVLLYWATIFAKSGGPWMEGLRRAPCDIARALQSSKDMIPGATISGKISPGSSGGDILEQAERLLYSTNPPVHSNSNGFSNPLSHQNVSPRAVAAAAAPPTSLPGLPLLPPPPHGLPLLPGMPGNEGPFLPPRPSDVLLPFTAEQKPGPEVMPIPRFRLPPPPGVSLAEWKDRLERRIRFVENYKPEPVSTPSEPRTATVQRPASQAPPLDHRVLYTEDGGIVEQDTSLPPPGRTMEAIRW